MGNAHDDDARVAIVEQPQHSVRLQFLIDPDFGRLRMQAALQDLARAVTTSGGFPTR